METKKILIVIGVLLIGVALGFAVGQIMGKKAGYQLAKKEYESEIQRLRTEIEKFWPIEPEMFSISGQVLEVKANSLLIETGQIHPLEKLPKVREVLVTEDTIIVKRTEKEPELLEPEIMGEVETEIEPYTETEINLSDIKVGNRVLVEADQDIKWAESFPATKIAVEF